MKKIRVLLSVLLVATCCAHCVYAENGSNFAVVDTLIEKAISQHKLPGAVLVVGHGGKVVYRRAYGMRSLEPQTEPMTLDTVFDMASLTKVMATTTAVMQLYQQGLFRLNDPVAKFIPEFGQNGKENVTIRQLLTHYSGLAPDVDLKQPWTGKDKGLALAFSSKLEETPGTTFRYSDINFIVLGALVERLSGVPLEQYVKQYVTTPLGMKHSGFLPSPSERNTIAPTSYDDDGIILRGTVHDPTARRMGGVAGHAGLFSTAGDAALFCQALLDRLNGNKSNFPLQQIYAKKMTTPEEPATGTSLRGLGWDIDSPLSSNRGELFPVGSFGHTGFTGTSLWLDPESDTYVILLSNSVHPNSTGSVIALRAQVATAVAAGLNIARRDRSATLTGYNESLSGMRSTPARNGHTLTGVDVLEADHFTEIKQYEKKLSTVHAALFTNNTGVDAQGRRTIDVLHNDAEQALTNFTLVKIFSPEHGIAGAKDTEDIADTKDSATGLPVISLYGAKEQDRKPSSAALAGVDLVIVDLADAGVRFYTYEAALGYMLEECQKAHVRVMVLDRPNPLNGAFVQGPISDWKNTSYTSYMPVPVRHGLTLGELALYYNGEKKLNADLQVVAMQDWQRGDWFDSTSIEWINPSPNLRSLAQATTYPGIGLIEGSNISVGRGTDTPFLKIGAPWMDAKKLAGALNARFIPGIRFIPVQFTPDAPYPYAGQLCNGVELNVINRDILDSPRMGIEVAVVLATLYPSEYKLDKTKRLVANDLLFGEMMQGANALKLREEWEAGVEDFKQKRAKYLIY